MHHHWLPDRLLSSTPPQWIIFSIFTFSKSNNRVSQSNHHLSVNTNSALTVSRILSLLFQDSIATTCCHTDAAHLLSLLPETSSGKMQMKSLFYQALNSHAAITRSRVKSCWKINWKSLVCWRILQHIRNGFNWRRSITTEDRFYLFSSVTKRSLTRILLDRMGTDTLLTKMWKMNYSYLQVIILT